MPKLTPPTRDEALEAIERAAAASPLASNSYELREVRNIVVNSEKSRMLPAAYELIDRLETNNDAYTNHEAAAVIRAYVQYVPAPSQSQAERLRADVAAAEDGPHADEQGLDSLGRLP